MSRIEQADQCKSRASMRGRWFVACFLALIAFLLAAGPATTMHAADTGLQYVTSGSGADLDCDQSHDGLGVHCHATATGAATARTELASILFDDNGRGYPMSIAHSDLSGRTLRPNLQPPRLHQA